MYNKKIEYQDQKEKCRLAYMSYAITKIELKFLSPSIWVASNEWGNKIKCVTFLSHVTRRIQRIIFSQTLKQGTIRDTEDYVFGNIPRVYALMSFSKIFFLSYSIL